MPPKQKPRVLKPSKRESSSSKDTSPAKKRQQSARISAACEACKKRKTKCTGGPPPCTLCHSLGTECVIDLSLDMRRRTAMQRTIDESKTHKAFLDGLLEIIRDGDEQDVDAVLDHVRSRCFSEQQLATSVRDGVQAVRNRNQTDGFVKLEHEERSTSFLQSDGAGLSNFSPEPEMSRRSYALEDGMSSTESGKGKDREEEPDSAASDHAHLFTQLRMSSDTEAGQSPHDFRFSTAADDPYRAPEMMFRGTSLRVEPGVSLMSSTPFAGWHFARHEGGSLSERLTRRTSLPPVSTTIASAQIDRPSLPPIKGEDGHLSTGAATRSSSRASSGVVFRPSSKIMSSSASDSVTTNTTRSQIMHKHHTPLHVEVFGSLPASYGMLAEYYPSPMSEIQVANLKIPIHMIQPLIVRDASPLSRVYVNYRDAARQMIATGAAPVDLVGGYDVAVDLFFRERRPSDPYTCASWASELCRSFIEFDRFTLLATIMMLTRFMRWIVQPTAETYAMIPDTMRPTNAQLFIPHVAAIDLALFPGLRNSLIDQHRDLIAPMCHNSLGVSWYHGAEAAIDVDPSTGSRSLSRAFRDHVCIQHNWTINSKVFQQFPELAGQLRTIDHDEDNFAPRTA